MTTKRLALATGLVLVGSFGLSMPAKPASASPPASATPASTSAPPHAPEPLSARGIPEQPSPSPSDDEWKTARSVKPQRGDPGRCTLRLLREWLEVVCRGLSGAGLVAGDPKGVAVKAKGEPFSAEQPQVRVVLPLRRGEAKIVTFVAANFEHYEGVSLEQAGTLSVVWRSARPDPVLVMRGFPS